MNERIYYDTFDYAHTKTSLRDVPPQVRKEANSFGEIVGVFMLPSNNSEYFLVKVKETSLDTDITIFRYVTTRTAVGGLAPFVKVNKARGLVYCLTEDAIEYNRMEFEKKGIKVRYLRLLDDFK